MKLEEEEGKEEEQKKEKKQKQKKNILKTNQECSPMRKPMQ